ncbi:MAG: ABC transporter substrate-binding protein [Candidatus Njordarchaeia archaeon]
MEVFNEYLGEKISIPDEPRSIVSLSPNITEILFMIGLDEEIVGVSYFCNKPEKAKTKPRVGSYLNVDFEKIKKLEPDLVLTTTGAQRETNKKLLKMGIPVFPVGLPTSLYGILENIWIVGNIVNRIEEARELIKSLEAKISNILKNKPRKVYRLYWEIDLGDPITAGAPSFVDTGITLAGAKNIFGDIRKNYFQPDFQEVKERNPEVILFEPQPTKKQNLDDLIATLKERGLGNIDAVKFGHIYITPSDFFSSFWTKLYRRCRTG